MELKDYQPILPLPGSIIEEMAAELAVSRTLLYSFIRQAKLPGALTQKRICRLTDLDPEIWSLPPHEAAQQLYDWFRSSKPTSEEPESKIEDVL